MKKIITGLLATFLVAAGLLSAGSTTAAQAGPYTGTVNTNVSITKVDYNVNKARKFRATVLASGSSRPQGSLQFALFRGGSTKAKALIKYAEHTAPTDTFNTPVLRNGKYTLRVCYSPKPGSVWKDDCSKRVFYIGVA